MDKLKQTFSKNKSDDPEDITGAGGTVTGQGAHFRSARDTTGLGSTTAGTDPEATGTPSTTAATADDGTAAIGQTSTYSSTPLAKGEPTSSVVDPESSDPTSYQKPEATYEGGAGVPAGSATAAASLAFGNSQKQTEHIPGAFPAQDNLPVRTADQHGMSDATAAATAVTGGAAHSGLASTTSPTERTTVYDDADKDRGLGSGTATTEDSQAQPGMVGKVLGAVGLSSLAGAGAAKATSSHDDSAVADNTDQPISTTGVASQTVPQHSGPPPEHHRKESIPTTAYPAGPDSPRPVAPPVGGTQPQEPIREQEQSHRDRDAAIGAAALGAGTHPETRATEPEKEDHTARNAAAAGAVGVGAGAAGAYAAHEYSSHQSEEEAARRAAEQKELARKQAEQQKELERQQKAQEKAAAKEEKQHEKEIEKHEKAAAKEEKKHQKELEKEEKEHKKEVERQGKERQKEIAAAEAERQRQEEQERKRLEQEEEEKRRREKEAAAGAGVGAIGAGSAATAYEAHKDRGQKDIAEEGEKEKKPSILKRIFKRTRKNKDTGEDEEYEEEGEEEHDSHEGLETAAGIGVVGTAVGGGIVYGSKEEHGEPTSTAADTTGKPTTTTAATTAEETTKPSATTAADPSDKYQAQSGGMPKPSYNPFKKDDPTAAQTLEQERTSEKVPYETGPTASTTERGAETVVPAAASEKRTEPTTTTSTGATDIEQHTTSSTSPYAATAAETASSDKPVEPVTGLPYDPSKDPVVAKRIEDRDHGAIKLMEEAKAEREKKEAAGEDAAGHGTHGEEKEGLGQKMKGMLHLGGGVKEADEKLKEEGFEHHQHQHHHES